MQIAVVIEPIGANLFRVEAPAPISLSAEGPSPEAALQNLRERIAKEFTNGREQISVASNPPWLNYVGHLKDDPLFDEWQAAIQEYRRQRDAEDGIEPEPRA